MSFLAFSTQALESCTACFHLRIWWPATYPLQAYLLRRNVQLLRHDAAWALFWLMVGSVGIRKAANLPWDRHTLQEVAAVCGYMAWSPLLLWLIKYRTELYLRYRSAVLVAMRIVRSALVLYQLDQRQTLWIGAAPPASFFIAYLHLCHKVNFLLLAGLGVLLPMRLHLPLHLAFLLLMLRATAQRCRAECGMPHAAVAAQAGSQSFQLYYAKSVRWLRRLNPRTLWRLPEAWRPTSAAPGSCLTSCYAVHAWFQAVGGVLFPLALLWVWEERLRARELRSWRRALAQQQHDAEQRLQAQQQQQQQGPKPDEPAGSGEGSQQQQQLRQRRRQEVSTPPLGSPVPPGSSSTQGSPVWRQGTPPPLPQDLPLPFAFTALWFVLSAWLVWQLLEAALL